MGGPIVLHLGHKLGRKIVSFGYIDLIIAYAIFVNVWNAYEVLLYIFHRLDEEEISEPPASILLDSGLIIDLIRF